VNPVTPTFVEYGPFSNGPAPYSADGAELYVFFLEGDHDLLQHLLDRVFRDPSGGRVRYHALGSHVMLTLGTMDVRSLSPGFDRMGYVTELHAAFWILTAATGPLRLASFIPMILVENPLSVVGGREVIGYNKAYGWVALPDPKVVDAFSLDGFGGDFHPDTCAQRVPLLSIQRAAEPLAARVFDSVEEAIAHTHAHLFPGSGELVAHGLRVGRSIFDDLKAPRLRQTFLRQFRAPQGGTAASQQQIVETLTSARDVSVELLPHDFDVTVHSYDSHPLGPELGLGNQRVAWGLRMRLGFTQDVGDVIWDAAGH
jgi:hypothetical protein